LGYVLNLKNVCNRKGFKINHFDAFLCFLLRGGIWKRKIFYLVAKLKNKSNKMASENEKIAHSINCDDNGVFRSNSLDGTRLIEENALNEANKILERRSEMDFLVRQMQEGLVKALNIDLPNNETATYSKGAVKNFIEIVLRKPFDTIDVWAKNPNHEFHLVGKRLKRYLTTFLESRKIFSKTEIEFLHKVQKHTNTREAEYIELLRQLKQPTKGGINYVENGYVDSVSISNYFSIQGLDFKDLKNSREIYFVGENGDGKTLLLQALLMGLKGGELANKSTDREQIGRILQYQNENPRLNIRVFDDKKHSFGRDTLAMRNVFAYGANRNKSTTERYDPLGYLTLFHDDKALRSPIQWLKDLELEERENENTLKVGTAIKLLEEILDDNVKISLKGSKVKFIEGSQSKISFKERHTEGLSFEQLSDGYRSVMTWVADLVARLATNQPTVKQIQDYEGIVIIDELGLHLHPKWEERLVAKLRHWFPKIQFFFSTHSPVMILSASRDAVFYRVYKEEGVTKISQPFYCAEMSDLMINSILTSPLFDLPDVLMRSFDPKKDDAVS
jgi:predicted ATPase